MEKKLYFRIDKGSEYYNHLKEYGINYKKRDKFVRDFCEKHGIEGQQYATGFCGGNNKVPTEDKKKSIFFGIEATDYQILPVSKHFNKEKDGTRYMSKRSSLLKEYQNLVIEQNVVLNLFRFSPVHWFTDLFGERYQWNYLMNEEEAVIMLHVCEQWATHFERNAGKYGLEPCTEETWNEAFHNGYSRYL